MPRCVRPRPPGQVPAAVGPTGPALPDVGSPAIGSCQPEQLRQGADQLVVGAHEAMSEPIEDRGPGRRARHRPSSRAAHGRGTGRMPSGPTIEPTCRSNQRRYSSTWVRSMSRVELVGGAPREPAVKLLQVRGAGVGVAVAGQERAGQTVQTRLGGRVEDGHGDIGHERAPGRGTHVTRPTDDPSPRRRS
jgi:hypothetical protein